MNERHEIFTLRVDLAVIVGLALLFLAIVFLPQPAFLQHPGIMPLWLHTFAEIFSIVVSLMVFAIAWNTYSMERVANIMVLACALFAVGMLDLAHTLSYRGMPDFITPSDIEKGINFWLVARLLFAGAMFYVAVNHIRPLQKQHHRYVLLAGSILLTVVTYWLGLFHQDLWPRTFIEGQGLTKFKIGVEYTVVAILLVPTILFYRRAHLPPQEQQCDAASLFAASAVTILSELCFTMYQGATDAYNLFGHSFKIIAYLFIYRAVFIGSVRDPYARLQKVQEEVRASRQMLHSILDAVPVRIFWKDMKLQFTGGNRLFLQDAGVNDSTQLIGKNDFDFFPEHASEYQEVDRRVMLTTKPELNFVEQLQRPNGEKIWLLTSKVPLLGENGRAIGVLGTYIDISEYRHAEEELQFKSTLLAIQQNAAIDGMLSVSAERQVLSYNQRYVEIWGVPEELLKLGESEPLLHHELSQVSDPQSFLDRVRHLYERQHESSADEVVFKDGRVFERYSTPIFGEGSKYYGRLWTFHDITKWRRAEEEMRLASKVFDGTGEAITISDANVHILTVNKAFTDMTGYTLEEIKGKHPRMLSSTTGKQDQEFYDRMWETIRREGFWQGEVWDRHKSGRIYPKMMSISAIKDEQGEVVNYMSIAVDISERKEAEENIRKLAYYDLLTGLPNRSLLRDRIEQAVATAHRDQEKFALMFLDLDRFKYINDSMGHAAGDLLLQGVAGRLQNAIREGDTVSRIGGDEFVILLRDVDANDAGRVAHKLLIMLAAAYDIAGQKVHTHASIGISIYPDNARDVETLIKYADVAMYRAKEEGRNNFQFFAPEMNFRSNQLFELENDLRLAFECHEFLLHFQPQLDLHSGQVCGAEALLRWHNPQKGYIPPGKFIPVAEETGQIMAIGEWVLRSACQQLAKWRKQGMPHFPIAVNLSIRQLRQSDLHLLITKVLHETGLQAQDLELEITEGIMLGETEFVTAFWDQMQKLGVQLSIDDFGTGYSSLSYLKKLPVDKLKIDQSFVRDIEVDENDDAIVRSIIALGHQFKLRVIAEGVETAAQLEFLRNSGCDEIQGYYFSHPLPPDEFFKFINKQHKPDVAS